MFSSPDAGGTDGGGVSRPALSEYDRVARDRFAEVAVRLGLALRVDDAGNMYARREGLDPSLKPVIIGSHLDTVVPGGCFDGIMGVALALETVALLNDASLETLRPIEVVNWMGEEGARFPPAMLGSGLASGAWDAGYLHERVDPEGVRVGDALEAIGYLGDASNRLTDFHAALEAHIEQGVQLDDTANDVGIVPAIEPVRWCVVEVRGIGGHAGGPGPEGRREALVAAARMIVEAKDSSLTAGDFMTTVGRIEIEPGSRNVIPHLVRFDLDVRGRTDEKLDGVLDELSSLFERIADEEGVVVEMERRWSMNTFPFDERIQELLRAIAEERDAAWMYTRGRIGHDSVHLAAMGPTAMLFTRTTDGVSHAESEHAPWEAIVATAGIFVNAAHVLANEQEQSSPHTAVGAKNERSGR
jgi:N-carbamoyl-L-amino-acid hydrolase